MSFSLAVLISGGGSNLQSMIDSIARGMLEAEIKLVISNTPGAGGLKRARDHGIPVRVISHESYSKRKDHDAAIMESLEAAKVDLVCLAGYLRLIGREFVRAFPQRILNIHPSLLPAFPGLDAQQQAADAGVFFSGATVHFVNEKLDHGPVIIQAAVPAFPGEGREALARRILSLEHRIYPQAIQWLVRDRLHLDAQGWVQLRPDAHHKPLSAHESPFLVNPPLEAGF